MEQIELQKVDNVYMRVVADSDLKKELSDYLSFRPANYQFNPKFKAKVWDGVIRLMAPHKPFVYIGLHDMIAAFCEERGYQLSSNVELLEDVPDTYGYELAESLNVPGLKLYDYQNDYIVAAIRSTRSVSLSPTSSGKSFIQYCIFQHYYKTYGHRTLLIVPKISLVHQMASDFVSYGFDETKIHKSTDGLKGTVKTPLVITTWQSIVKHPKEWFEQFAVVLGDEAHEFQAKCLTSIMEKMTDTPYRHGFTGTISKASKIHQFVLTGLFGTIRRFVSTKELIDDGKVATFNVKGLVLNYSAEDKLLFKEKVKKEKLDSKAANRKPNVYDIERKFIFGNEKRNLFIRNLVWSLENQNNLILFDLIETHGKLIADFLKKEGRIIYFIHGGVDGDERERIRHEVENDPIKRYDIVASAGVFSTGVNLKRLDNAIFTSSWKSEIRILQSIGRTLRKGNGADNAVLYDITDNLTNSNYMLKHFTERMQIYTQEQFPLKLYNINL